MPARSKTIPVQRLFDDPDPPQTPRSTNWKPVTIYHIVPHVYYLSLKNLQSTFNSPTPVALRHNIDPRYCFGKPTDLLLLPCREIMHHSTLIPRLSLYTRLVRDWASPLEGPI